MDCKYRANGICTKTRGQGKCESCQISEKDFDSFLADCEVEEVCQKTSLWGNNLILINKEQLKLLKDGRVLYTVGEYGTFIMLDKEARDKDA